MPVRFGDARGVCVFYGPVDSNAHRGRFNNDRRSRYNGCQRIGSVHIRNATFEIVKYYFMCFPRPASRKMNKIRKSQVQIETIVVSNEINNYYIRGIGGKIIGNRQKTNRSLLILLNCIEN